MLTEKKLNGIHRLEPTEVLQIFLECEIALGIVDLFEAEKILCISKRRIYQKMSKSNSVQIGKHKFPCINLFK